MKSFFPLIFLAVLIILWQVASTVWIQNPLFFPSPTAVAIALSTHRALILHHAMITFTEAIAGFTIGCGSAIVLAALGSFFPIIKITTFPYAVAIKATPIIVLAPIIVMWLGNGFLSKALMAALVCFFPVLINASVGLQSVEKDWVNLLRLHHANVWDIFWKLRVPIALPEIFAGLRVATSLAMVGAIVAEFTGAQGGLGFFINTSLYYLNTDMVFAGVFVTSAMGLAIYYGVTLLHRKLVFWQLEN